MTTAERVQKEWAETSEYLQEADLIAIVKKYPYSKINYARHTVYEYEDGSCTCIEKF